ncbi:hypothetical protein GQ457_17G002540 [Hibiscus cannabinus]
MLLAALTCSFEALSVKEKRKRGRALKKCKKVGERNVPSELVVYSPTDSDIARMQNLRKEARVTLELGKILGIEFVGDEEEGWSVDFKVGVVLLVGFSPCTYDMASIFLGPDMKVFNETPDGIYTQYGESNLEEKMIS